VNRPARPTHPAAFAIAGFAVMIGLHALFVIGWDRFFAVAPWPGYEESTRLGMVEPWFVNTPRSLWITRAVLFGVAFGVVLPVWSRRLHRVLALWIGAAAAVAITWVTTTARTFEGGVAGFVYYPLRVGLPLLVGAVVALVVQRVAGRSRS
jgi:hypothetical protein